MITTEQLEKRRKYVGSSDIAAILGMSPWKSAYDVWLDKTGKLEDQPANTAQAMGTRLEPVILDWLQEAIGKPVIRDTQFVHSNGIMIASLDGLIEYGEKYEHAEAKYSTQADEWGDDGTDEIPDGYQLQIAHQFACVPDSLLCHVPCMLIAGRRLEMRKYVVQRNPDLIDVVQNAAADFWTNHVLADVPPENSDPSMNAAKAMRREPGKTISIASPVAEEYNAAKAIYKDAEAHYDKAKAALLAAMGDAEEADSPAGRFTYRQQSRFTLDTEKIKAVLPAWKDYQKTTTFRVLREGKQK